MRPATRTLRGLLGVLTLCISSGLASAQTGQNFGELVGKAMDDQGAVLPGVTVILTGLALMWTMNCGHRA